MPTGEVSAIYKQDGRVRKIHLVVVAPDLPAARWFGEALGRLGNVESDGRPILGLSARDITEIALGCDDRMEIVPAHVWTPGSPSSAPRAASTGSRTASSTSPPT